MTLSLLDMRPFAEWQGCLVKTSNSNVRRMLWSTGSDPTEREDHYQMQTVVYGSSLAGLLNYFLLNITQNGFDLAYYWIGPVVFFMLLVFFNY